MRSNRVFFFFFFAPFVDPKPDEESIQVGSLFLLIFCQSLKKKKLHIQIYLKIILNIKKKKTKEKIQLQICSLIKFQSGEVIQGHPSNRWSLDTGVKLFWKRHHCLASLTSPGKPKVSSGCYYLPN